MAIRISVFGGANMDILGVPEGELRLRDSNIGRVILRPGGVGRNIAEQIVRLGGRCALFTVFGTDSLADMLCASCARLGIDITHALTAEGATCVYLCLHEESGDMLAAVNDMRLTRLLTPDYAKKNMDRINAADLCVLDANAPVETVRYIAENAAVPLFMDPVSVAKLDRARAVLPRLAAIKPNILEARALTGCQDAAECANALVRGGAQKAFVSLGAEGICCADHTGCRTIPVRRPSAAVKTGVGDALCAGLAMALAAGENTWECAEYGMRCAADFLENEEENT